MVDDADRLRHTHPGAPRRHRHGNIGAPHTRRKRAQCSVGAGVRIGAHDNVARHHQPLLWQQHVLDAHAAHVKIVGHSLFPRKLAQDQALLRRLDVLVGGKVISHHHHPFGIKNLERTVISGKLGKLADRDGCGDVVAQDNVHVDLDELPRAHGVLPGVRSQDLFCHRVSH